jgi:hypothetical protein
MFANGREGFRDKGGAAAAEEALWGSVVQPFMCKKLLMDSLILLAPVGNFLVFGVFGGFS